MISKIRSSFKTQSSQVVLWILLFAMAGTGSFIGLLRRSMGPDGTVAFRVNGVDVPMNVLRARTANEEQRIAMIRERFGPAAPQMLSWYGLDRAPVEIASEELLFEAIVSDLSYKLGIAIDRETAARGLYSQGFVRSAIGNVIPQELMDHRHGNDGDLLKRYLERQGLSMAFFDALVENAVRRAAVTSIIAESAVLPEAALKDQYVARNAARQYSYATLPLSYYRNQISLTDIPEAELRAFYERENETRRRYWRPEARTGTIWKISSSAYPISVSDERIGAYYDSHKAEFVEPSGKQKPLSAVKAQIKELLTNDIFRSQFSADAQRIIRASPDEFAGFLKDKKAESSKVDRATEVTSLAHQKLFNLGLNRKGYVVDGHTGSIIELVKIDPAQLPSFEEVRDQVAADYRDYRALEEAYRDISVARSASSGFEELVHKVGAKVEKTALVTPDSAGWKQLTEKGLPTNTMIFVTAPGVLIDRRNKEGIVLVRLNECASVDSEHYVAQKEKLWQELIGAEMQMMLATSVAHLQKIAIIKSYQQSQNTPDFLDF